MDDASVRQFVQDGYVRVNEAFSEATAAEARARLWRETGCDSNDPSTWTRPVVRLAGYGGGPFAAAVNTPVLHAAFDQLVGRGRWVPRDGLGTFPIRFPHPDDPGDAGWHVDVSFPPATGPSGDEGQTMNYLKWRANLHSRGRALLMLFLFSDVGEDDAPTRIRIGSHLTMAKVLEPYGEEGLDAIALSHVAAEQTSACKEIAATGDAGTVYLCHPFLVHAAQPHRGTRPRFMAQPSLDPSQPFQLTRPERDYSAVETAIRLGIGLT